VDEAAVRDRRDDPDLVVSGLDRETVVEPPGAVRLRADDGAGVLEDGIGELGLDAVAGLRRTRSSTVSVLMASSGRRCGRAASSVTPSDVTVTALAKRRSVSGPSWPAG
jgi:hypothetical protein